MKIALIQPVTGTESTKVVRVVREPLGLLYIAAAINDKSFCSDIKTTKYQAKIFHPIERVEPGAVIPWDDNVLINRLKEFAPDAVGISTMTYNFEKGIEIARKIKDEIGDVPIIFGGYHVSGCIAQYRKWRMKSKNRIFLEDLENVFNTNCVDYVVFGEGEETIVELLECLSNNKDVSKVGGIAYQIDSDICIRNRSRMKNLDSIPFPERSQLDWKLYKSSASGETVATIHTLRGCRYKCAYCSTPTTWGAGISRRSPKNVVDEIEYLVNNFSVNRISFADEDFFYDFERVHQICNEIIRRNIHIKWDSFASIGDLLRDDAEELLRNMKEAGCISFFVGIESLNIKTLIEYNRPQAKRYNIEEYLVRVQKAIDVVSSVGIAFFGDYMIGYPKETEEEMREGFDKLKELRNMPYVYLPILGAFPGTRLYEECKKNDWFLEGKSFKDFNCSQQVLKCKTVRIDELRDEFETEFYTNKKYINDFIDRIKADPKQIDQIIYLYTKLTNDYPHNMKLSKIRDRLINYTKLLDITLDTTFEDIINEDVLKIDKSQPH